MPIPAYFKVDIIENISNEATKVIGELFDGTKVTITVHPTLLVKINEKLAWLVVEFHGQRKTELICSITLPSPDISKGKNICVKVDKITTKVK